MTNFIRAYIGPFTFRLGQMGHKFTFIFKNTVKCESVSEKKFYLECHRNISLFPLGVGHGVQREGKECEDLVKTAKSWQIECLEMVLEC